MLAKRATYIGSLNATGVRRDDIGFRLAISRLLSGVDLLPPQLPPASILVVKKLKKPLPELPVSQVSNTQVDVGWEKEVRSGLAQLYKRAIRPDQGFVPSSADAILFVDQSEMLACLTLDLIQGRAITHWWWQLILKFLPNSSVDAIAAVLHNEAEYVPAVIHHLAEWRQTDAFLKAITPDQAMTVLSAVAYAHGVSGIYTRVSHASAASPHFALDSNRTDARSLPSGTVVPKESNLDKIGESLKAPWESWLPPEAVSTSLGKEKAFFLGVSLGLYYRPVKVRSNEFIQSMQKWWNRQAFSNRHGASNAKGESYKLESTRLRIADNSFDILKEPLRFSGNDAPEKPQIKTDTNKSYDAGGPNYTENKLNHDQKPVSPWRITDTPPARFLKDIYQPDHRRASDRKIRQDETLNLEGGVTTRLGGILYLVNLMHRLNLPACFEEDWGLAGQIGSWGLLDILARGFLYPTNEKYLADPIWQVLARLDGRSDGSLPGEYFCGSDRFYLPPEWVGQVKSQRSWNLLWSTNRTHLFLWSDQGYLLAEVPRSIDSASIQMRKVRRAYTRRAPVAAVLHHCPPKFSTSFFNAPLTEGLHPHIKRWLVRVLPYLQLRLTLALDLKSSNLEDLVKILLAYPGRLFVTSSHVDLVMDIDDISFPVRRVGLDVNPGWLPDFSRVIQFHYGKRG